MCVRAVCVRCVCACSVRALRLCGEVVLRFVSEKRVRRREGRFFLVGTKVSRFIGSVRVPTEKETFYWVSACTN